mmetsp:Transcript_64970/g.186969  ORF Transcript_64970/g.186969 Transcript_64970/m.186969 type:complete len:248 (-) Transcript_64970:66-809(-)
MHVVGAELALVATAGCPSELADSVFVPVLELPLEDRAVRESLDARALLEAVLPLALVHRTVVENVPPCAMLSVVLELPLVHRAIREHQATLAVLLPISRLALVDRAHLTVVVRRYGLREQALLGHDAGSLAPLRWRASAGRRSSAAICSGLAGGFVCGLQLRVVRFHGAGAGGIALGLLLLGAAVALPALLVVLVVLAPILLALGPIFVPSFIPVLVLALPIIVGVCCARLVVDRDLRLLRLLAAAP